MISLLFAAMFAGQVPPERAAATFTVSDPDLEWTLWASEPLFCNPTTIDIDHLGRVWVCEAVNYRCTLHGKPPNRPEGDRILILEASKGQGRADKFTVFAQAPYIQSPLGIAVAKHPTGPGWKVYVCQSPDILVFEDKDGDCKADGPPKKLLSGFRGVDHDHGVHGITIGPDGKLYFSVGDSGVKDLKSSDGKGRSWTTNKTDCQAGTIWRCDMDGSNLELIAHNFRNPYKPCVDSFGTIFVSDNDDDGNRETRICYVMPGGNYGYWPRGRGESHWHEDQPGVVPKILGTGFGSPTGMCVYEGTLLPKKYWGRVLHTDAGPRQLRAYTMKPQGAGYECLREDIVNSSDTWFRPSDVCVAPDGSVFVADWYDPGVGGHGMGDLKMGRIYRLAPKGSRYAVPKIDFEGADGLMVALLSPASSVRAMASSRFGQLDSKFATEQLAAQVDPARADWIRARAIQGIFRRNDFFLQSRIPIPLAIRLAGQVKANEAWFSPFMTRMLDSNVPFAKPKPLDDRAFAKLHALTDAGRREILLTMRHGDGADVEETVMSLGEFYDGRDRFYLAAIGIAVGNDPRRREVILADFDKQFPEWNDTVADLVWELRPPVMMPKLVKLLNERKLSEQQRARIVDVLATQEVEFGKELLRARNDETSEVVRERIVGHVEKLLPGKWKELRPSLELTATIESLLGKRETVQRGLALIAAGQRDDLTSRVMAIANDGSIDAVRTLGILSTPEAVSTLQSAIANLQQPFSFRAASLQSLARSRAGTQWLIDNTDRIPDDLRIEAGRLLRNSPYQDLRDKARIAFPPPTKLDMTKLPEIATLAKMRGNVDRGKAVLAASVKNDAACLKCHTVNGEGGQVGPDLSAIGAKASRENLYESLLYPSKAVADQFAQWRIETKKGVTILGLIVEETADEVLVRDANGKDTRIDKKAIESREKSRNSLMPEDNAATLTMEELVDLVEYLMTLKAPAKPANR